MEIYPVVNLHMRVKRSRTSIVGPLYFIVGNNVKYKYTERKQSRRRITVSV
jgi:hypothetical protein